MQQENKVIIKQLFCAQYAYYVFHSADGLPLFSLLMLMKEHLLLNAETDTLSFFSHFTLDNGEMTFIA